MLPARSVVIGQQAGLLKTRRSEIFFPLTAAIQKILAVWARLLRGIGFDHSLNHPDYQRTRERESLLDSGWVSGTKDAHEKQQMVRDGPRVRRDGADFGLS